MGVREWDGVNYLYHGNRPGVTGHIVESEPCTGVYLASYFCNNIGNDYEIHQSKRSVSRLMGGSFVF